MALFAHHLLFGGILGSIPPELIGCNVEGPAEATRNPPYVDGDPYYSNQGQAGTCVRHAIAKALYREISGYTERTQNPVYPRTSDLVAMLLNLRPELGANGTWPTIYDDLRGTAADNRGNIYRIHFKVWEQTNARDIERGAFHVICIDLHHLFPNEYDLHSWHAMFSQYKTSDGFEFRNSWGRSKERIRLTVDELRRFRARLFYVTVMDCRRHVTDKHDEVLASGGRWQNLIR